jgi:hypothetical protein
MGEELAALRERLRANPPQHYSHDIDRLLATIDAYAADIKDWDRALRETTKEKMEADEQLALASGAHDNLEMKYQAERLSVAQQDEEIARLRAQLPDGMKDCFIQFLECEKGHGRLTAANWVQRGCDTCRVAKLEAAITAIHHAFTGSAHGNRCKLAGEMNEIALAQYLELGRR